MRKQISFSLANEMFIVNQTFVQNAENSFFLVQHAQPGTKRRVYVDSNTHSEEMENFLRSKWK